MNDNVVEQTQQISAKDNIEYIVKHDWIDLDGSNIIDDDEKKMNDEYEPGAIKEGFEKVLFLCLCIYIVVDISLHNEYMIRLRS